MKSENEELLTFIIATIHVTSFIFSFMKLLGVIDVSWFIVLFPYIFDGLGIIATVFFICMCDLLRYMREKHNH